MWQEGIDQGVTQAVIPGVSPEQWSALPALCQKLPGTHFAVGLHPWWIDNSVDIDELELSLREAAAGAVAIGETGLDQSERGRRTPLERQRELLEVHLRVANDLELPFVLHCVKAHEPMLEVLSQTTLRKGGMVHSFSGSQKVAKQLLDNGLHLSFSCAALRFSNKKNAAIEVVPDDRLLIETDAPDQSADRTRPGSPVDVIEVARQVAKARSGTEEDVTQMTRENAERLFGITSE